MQLISGITSDPKQEISIPLPSGDYFTFRLQFRPQQRGWFYDIAYSTRTNSFAVNGRRLVTTPNLLRQFQDIIPFGLSVVTQNDAEPTTQSGLADGTVTLLLLDSDDIAEIEATIYTGS